MSSDPVVLVFGDINVDLTWEVPTLPAAGDDCTAAGLGWGSGGAGLNVAATLATLGALARLAGRVGQDPFAEVALAEARRRGVELGLLQQDPACATGLCSVAVTPDGQRTFYSFRGANVQFDPAGLGEEPTSEVSLLFVNAYALLGGSQAAAVRLLLARAQARGLPVALDLCRPAIRNCRDWLLALLPRLWLLTLNRDELTALLPGCTPAEGLVELERCGAAQVALKLGAQGCLVRMAGETLTASPPQVVVRDTTGCGDAFAAAFAWARLRHADLEQAASLGNLLGALTATAPGSATAVPDRSLLLRHARSDPRLTRLLEG